MPFKNNPIDISLVIPAFKEEKRIGVTLDDLAEYIQTDSVISKLEVEVIVVSADAEDKTQDEALSKKHLFEHFIFVAPGPKVGKGRDVKEGMFTASGKAILFMDADRATPLRHISEFYNLFLQGKEIIIGTRNLSSHHPNIFRRFVSIIGNLLFRIVSGIWIADSQCGFKLFSSRASHLCFSNLSIMGWGFDMEILSIAHANKIPITAVLLNDWHDVPGGTFEIKLFRNIISSLNDLGKIFINRIFNNYRFK